MEKNINQFKIELDLINMSPIESVQESRQRKNITSKFHN